MLQKCFCESSSDEKGYREKGFKSIGVNSCKSCFAAIVPGNIKLLYLNKSLIRDLLQDPTSFEKKIVGSFVRMKSDTNSKSQNHSFQLQLVTGVENFSLAVSPSAEIHLKVANFPKEVTFSMLSDDDFSEEEVEDLRKRIMTGMLKKISVKEIELKAQMLHEDITKHKKSDLANVKGWRREFFEYQDQMKILHTQEKVLPGIPVVIAEEIDALATVEARALIAEVHDSGSMDTSITENEVATDTAVCESSMDQYSSMPQPTTVPQEFQVKPVPTCEMIELSSDDEQEPEPDRNAEPTNIADWYYMDPRGKMQGPFTLQALKRWSDSNFFKAGFMVWKTCQAPSDGVPLVDVLRQSFR